MANSSDMNVALRFQADVSQARAELKALRADAEAIGQGTQKINTAPIDKLSDSAKLAGTATKGMGTAAKSAGADTKGLADASNAATTAAQAQAKAVNNAAKANQAAGISAKQLAAANRMLPAQMTDITVGLATGQNPITVALQQGGQLKDMYGGIAPAAKAVSGAVMGMVNPYTMVAAAVAVLIAGYAKGSKESDAYYQSIVMTGNAVGATTSQLAIMATRIDGVVGTTYDAAQALAALASTGQVSSKNIEQLATTTVRMERVMGQAISATVEQFNELGRSPVEASRKLNESYNYLTDAVYAQIKALVAQRKEDEAAELAQKTFSAAMDERTAKLAANAGTLEKAWRGVRDVVRETWDAILAVGRPQTDDAAISASQKQVDFLRQRLESRQSRNLATGDLPAKLAAAEANLAAIQTRKATSEQSAADESANRQLENARIKARDSWDKRAKDLQTNAEKLKEARAAILAEAKLLGKDQTAEGRKEIEKQLAEAAEKYKDRKAAGPKVNPVDTAFQTQLQTLQQARAQAEQGLANAQDNVGSSTDQATAKLEAWLAVNKNALKLDDARIAQLRQVAAETDRLNKSTKDLQDTKARNERITQGLAAVDESISQAQGRTAEAAVTRIEERFRKLRDDLGKTGNLSGLAKVDQLVGIESARAQLEGLQQQADRIFSDQSRTEQSLANQVTAGLTGELEAKRQILNINTSTAAQIEALLPKMRELAEITGNPAAIDRVKDLEVRIQGLRTKANEVSQAFGNAFGNSLSNSLKSLADGTASLGEAVRGLLSNLAQGMGEWAAQQLALRAQEGVMGLINGASKTAAGAGAAASAAAGVGAVVDTAGAAAEATATAASTAATVADTAATTAAAAATTAMATAATLAATALQAVAASSASSGASSALGALGAGFSGGGWTGPGTKYQPAGIVHADEFVHRQEVVRQPGALAFLTRFNQVGMAALKGWQGYAEGGLVVGSGASLGIPAMGNFKPATPASGGNTTVDNKLLLNLIDDPDRIASVMGSGKGEQAFTVLLSRNPAKYRQLLGV